MLNYILQGEIIKMTTNTTPIHGSNIPRTAINPDFQWRIEHIFPSLEAWQEACQNFKQNLQEILAYQCNISNAEQLYACLDKRDELSQTIEHLYAYARLQRDADNSNQTYQSIVGQAESILAEFSNTISFIEPEILTLSETKINAWLNNYSPLKKYAHNLCDLIRQSEHILPAREEEIIARTQLFADSSANIFRILTGADLQFPNVKDANGTTHTVSEGQYLLNMTSNDRVLRKNTFTALMSTYGSYRNTLASTLSGNCRSANFYATIHKYKDTLASSLAADNIPATIYDNLITTIHNNLEPLHNYIALKKEFLGINEFHAYDLYVSLSPAGAESFSYTYEEACTAVKDATKPLGSNYNKILAEGLNSGWVDIYENKGKRSGAYSWGIFGIHPYVLLNYQPRYNSISTLAHEMGHALHSYLSSQAQSYNNADYTIFCAEVASTTNEILLLEYMLKKATKPQKIYLLNQFLEAVRTTVYRQVQFAEFEKIIHTEISNGKTLTAEYLETLWRQLNIKYYGPALTIDKELDNEWSRIPHFYTPFYVYKYATGYSAATTFADNILKNTPQAVEKYLHFLSSGGSDYSLNLLKEAGVDLNTPEPVTVTLNKFAEKLKELQTLLQA